MSFEPVEPLPQIKSKGVCQRTGCFKTSTHTVVLAGCADGEIELCERHADEALSEGDALAYFGKKPITAAKRSL